jgi:Cd2+/Zn2+-exporting ATPase
MLKEITMTQSMEHEKIEHPHHDGCCCGRHENEIQCDTSPVAKAEAQVHYHYHIPGHPENCRCDFCNPQAKYCDVCGESLENCTCPMPDADLKKQVFILENLGCANCAAKMEAKIKELPAVKYASVTFATKQLRVSARDPLALRPAFQRICESIESNVRVVPRQAAVKDLPKAAQSEEGGSTKTKTPVLAERWEKISIILGTLLFGVTEAIYLSQGMDSYPPVLIALLVAAYLILGGEVVWTALRNLFKGQVFDENFLMSVATLGAFAIAQYPEAVGVMLFYRIGEYFEDFAVERSRGQIMEAVDLRPEVVCRVTGATEEIIPAGEAAVGDILLVRPGDRIPLDGVVVEGETRIDTSAVTGEPVPVKAGFGDEVVSGCVNNTGVIKIRVEKILEESMVSRILDAVENAAASKPHIDAFITRFARVYTPAVVGIAAFTALVIPLATGQAFYPWVYTALSFLVISCPCALVLSVPLAFFCGIGAGSKKGILFKGGVVIEALARTKAVVMDKTGTITKGDFSVQNIIPASGVRAEEVLRAAVVCEGTSTHPIATSIVAAAKDQGIALSAAQAVEEIAGRGVRARDGEDTLLCGNAKLLEAENIDLAGYDPSEAGTEVLVARRGCYLGQIVVSDTVKEGAREAIGRISAQNILTAMLTGDTLDNARRVAQVAGVEEVHARLMPQDKLTELQAIRDARGEVLFVGDGINDAPVLAGADVGAAMGSGADAAIEAADVVFMNSDMDAIPAAIALAKDTVRVSWQNVFFAMAVKIAVMILGLTGIYANMWLAVFADTGVAFLCILNSIRLLYLGRKK